MSAVYHDSIGVALSHLMEQERPRLTRYFQRRVARSEAVEDLVQETLLEAWRNQHKLQPGAVSPAWLFTIAHHVSLRGWTRHRLAVTRAGELEREPTQPDLLAESLERHELAGVLDRSLALLPELAREALVGHYLDDAPLAELAARQGIHEGAMATRLFRARQSLRQTLVQNFPDEALAYGLVEDATLWQETRIWCANCGRHHLRGRLPGPDGSGVFELRCPGCHPHPCHDFRKASLTQPRWRRAVGTTVGYRRILRRLDSAYARWHHSVLAQGSASCPKCGKSTPLRRSEPRTFFPTLQDRYGFSVACPECQILVVGETLGRLLMGQPELQAFWRENPRLRRLPETDLNYQGTAAILVRYESLTSSAHKEAICRKDTFELLALS